MTIATYEIGGINNGLNPLGGISQPAPKSMREKTEQSSDEATTSKIKNRVRASGANVGAILYWGFFLSTNAFKPSKAVGD